MKKFIAIALVLCLSLALVACDKAPANNTDPVATEKDYKLGMGIVVSTASSATGAAQIDATVAAVVTDADGKIVACRLDAVQNKIALADGAFTINNLKTKMELGDDYNMAKFGGSMDWNGDGVVKEWYDQAKAFEAYVVGKTGAEVEAMETQTVEGSGYIIAKDEALLSAGCTIQITDFKAAVAKACADEQGMAFKTAGAFTLGVAATSFDDSSANVTEDAEGAVKVYSDFAATVIADGKILATLNDAIQPSMTFNKAGEITGSSFKATKRELKEGYNMAAYGQGMDWNGDGKVLEWYLQSAAFSNYAVGKTAAEVEAIETQTLDSGYIIATDDALLSAGCTIQITSMKAVVAKAATNAR